jgi:hypothetical protein
MTSEELQRLVYDRLLELEQQKADLLSGRITPAQARTQNKRMEQELKSLSLSLKTQKLARHANAVNRRRRK